MVCLSIRHRPIARNSNESMLRKAATSTFRPVNNVSWAVERVETF
jgi:hypothetical protein